MSAAENRGTKVTVHACTPNAIRTAVEAGVKCLEHGQLIDEDTPGLLAEKGVWRSLQPFIEYPAVPSAFADGSLNRIKQLQMQAGTDMLALCGPRNPYPRALSGWSRRGHSDDRYVEDTGT